MVKLSRSQPAAHGLVKILKILYKFTQNHTDAQQHHSSNSNISIHVKVYVK